MSKQNIGVCSFKDTPVGDNVVVLNVTSRSKTWHRCFSPFLLGPVLLMDTRGIIAAENVENAWQYSKVYPEHIDENGNIKESYYGWRIDGWEKEEAVRYPMGKNIKPLYSLLGMTKLDYIEARKAIYVPIYTDTVLRSQYYKEYHFEKLVKECKDLINQGKEIYLWDFDVERGETLESILDNPNKKLGHAYILADMVNKALAN